MKNYNELHMENTADIEIEETNMKRKHPAIVAVDFDGTLCANAWPEIGAPNESLINHLIYRQAEEGIKLILWTCRAGEKLEAAVMWCRDRYLEFDAVNENLPEIVDAFDSDSRKIFANEYLDDRSTTYFNLPFGESSWAAQEVEMACNCENPDRVPGKFDYGCNCYESALKAYKSLENDGHSCFSVSITKQILNRIVDGKPLTPIEDKDEVWSDRIKRGNNRTTYQCKRMSSLFKDVYDDGSIKYFDVNNNVAVNIFNHKDTFSSGLAQKVIDEMFPVQMPYRPADKPYQVFMEDFLKDVKNGDFDTVGIHYVIKPNGEQVRVDRYFKEDSKSATWNEINADEYFERKLNAEKNKEDDKNGAV